MIKEKFKKIDIDELVRLANEKLKKALIESSVELEGLEIGLKSSSTGFGGRRYWFECPMCSRRARLLFVNHLSSSVGCRKCLGVMYSSQRYKGMVEGEILQQKLYEAEERK